MTDYRIPRNRHLVAMGDISLRAMGRAAYWHGRQMAQAAPRAALLGTARRYATAQADAIAWASKPGREG
jgi:hypothetical protein